MRTKKGPFDGPCAFRALAILLGCGLLVWGLTGCSTTSTEPDEVALQYEGGPFESVSFNHCIDPGTRSYDGPGDDAYTYPAGQRTATFGPGSELGEISVVSKDAVTLGVSGVVTYTLNTDCETLQKFHESIGIKYQAWTDDGWTAFLRDYMGQPLNQGLDVASKDYTMRALYVGSVKPQWEESVQEDFTAAFNKQAGGDYFTNVSLTLQKPVPPESIVDALTARTEAIERNQAAQEEQQVQRTEGESLKLAMQDAGIARPGQPITPSMLDAYTRWLAVNNGDIQLYVLPEGSGVNVGSPPQ